MIFMFIYMTLFGKEIFPMFSLEGKPMLTARDTSQNLPLLTKGNLICWKGIIRLSEPEPISTDKDSPIISTNN